MQKIIPVFIIFCFISISILAQSGDDIIGEWYTDGGKSLIKIYKAKNQMYYGKIIWLKEPDENGKPKLDNENPDPSKRNEPLMGLLLLRAFTFEGNNVYKDGTIYDPENGKTYKCSMTMQNKNTLEVRGYIGISAIGRTTVWKRKS